MMTVSNVVLCISHFSSLLFSSLLFSSLLSHSFQGHLAPSLVCGKFTTVVVIARRVDVPRSIVNAFRFEFVSIKIVVVLFQPSHVTIIGHTVSLLRSKFPLHDDPC